MDSPTRFFYDTEFVEDGKTIDLISIGMVAEDGRKFYRVSSEFDWQKANNHDFVYQYVLPYLPGKFLNASVSGSRPLWVPYLADPLYADRDTIAVELIRWMWDVQDPHHENVDEVELWAWYGAYDHIALMQLWGPMMAKPPILPMFTKDLRQRIDERDIAEIELNDVERTGDQHNALDDARWNLGVWNYVESRNRVVEL